MLINRESEEGRAGEGPESNMAVDHTYEYHTASELFEIMDRDQDFDSNDIDENEVLTANELITLYENIDVGSKLINTAIDIKRPNQRVETIVYHEDPDSDSSDLSDINSKEDLNNIFSINNTMLDLLDSPPSLQNDLCQKLGNLQIQSSNLNTGYHKNFLFKDPYIKEQLKSLNVMANCYGFGGTGIPTSLLDYICCKRLEDDYNFYMDNIIRYVNYTIEHLKRISNGDYLTDKAKQKWREVERNKTDSLENKKVLATSTSIPLHVEQKNTGCQSTWDEIFHSEIDIRSLSKILEKKIVLEIPKMIRGPDILFNQCYADNLVISSKKEKQCALLETKEESRVEVVLQLKRSDSGKVITNLNSIMILHTTPVLHTEPASTEALTLLNSDDQAMTKECAENKDDKIKIIELNDNDVETNQDTENVFIENFVNNQEYIECDTPTHNIEYTTTDKEHKISSNPHSNQESNESGIALREILHTKAANSNIHNIITPDELRFTMQRLNIQSSLPEEAGEDMQNSSVKMKSSTRIRIKSPYENKSYIIEEKKRRKLLEIRERREKKKMAFGEHCKITKHRYNKGNIMPQPSSSVTKLSITNKSFYNSIYGENIHIDSKINLDGRRGKKRSTLGDNEEKWEGENNSLNLSQDGTSKKYINRSYYLDDAVTEMQMKRHNAVAEICSTSTSAISTDFGCILSQAIAQPDSNFNDTEEKCISHLEVGSDQSVYINEESEIDLNSSGSNLNIVPANSPKINEADDKTDLREITTSTSIECRKSIEKLYDLMSKLRKSESDERKFNKCKIIHSSTHTEENKFVTQGISFDEVSDSGTSFKHHMISSNASYIKKINNPNVSITKHVNNKKSKTLSSVIPKVIISAKSQTVKCESDKNKKDKKTISVGPSNVVPENPLRAISQLLHEFDSVQKTRQKFPVPKQNKKNEIIPTDNRVPSRQSYIKRRSRFDQHLRNNEQIAKNITSVVFKDVKPIPPKELLGKIPNHQVPIPIHETNVEKLSKKRMSDIIDEAKEARGEAVRGPSKLTRLNTLAQPKRSYVQAQSEEYQIKNGRNKMTDRLQRLTKTPAQPTLDRKIAFPILRNVQKRSGPEIIMPVHMKPPPPSMSPSLEKTTKLHFSTNPISGRKVLQPKMETLHKSSHVPESPEALKVKMGVESYVNNHYERVLPAVVTPELQMASRSRVPVIAKDTDLVSVTSSSSAEKSTVLGRKLHNIIHTMINSSTSEGAALSVKQKTASGLIKDTDELSIIDNNAKEEARSLHSDYRIDVFQDNNVLTAVEGVKDRIRDEFILNNIKNCKLKKVGKYDIQPFNSYTELQQLEYALYRRLSIGTLNKRLRINNLTLTPRQSMRQVVIVQSGDANSIVLNTSTSQNLQKTNSYIIEDLKPLNILTSSQLEWRCGNIPMQIATVGYAFPKYQSVQCNSSVLSKSLINISKNETKHLSNLKLQEANISSEIPINKTEQGVQVEVYELPFASIPGREKSPNDIITEIEKRNTFNNQTEDYKKKYDVVTKKSENINCTTSLDMLVGLLNEIQKITCQTQLNVDDDVKAKQPETVLNNAVPIEDVRIAQPLNMVSVDKLNHLESSSSVRSVYVSNTNDIKQKQINLLYMDSKSTLWKCEYADKEVNVDITEKDFVNTCTDVPSSLFPITLNHSTNITDSLIGILSAPSNQSIFSLKDYHVYTEDSAFNYEKKIIELSSLVINSDSLVACQDTEASDKTKEKLAKPIMKIDDVAKIKSFDKTLAKAYSINNSEIDPLIKIKRDILVTVYSMLVITVLAALSFPEILYHT
ncbi:uncharacterized protein LOC131855041 [Achroia grisella]|uniref:uncharacterized protein LOC131855041 n=1 Tax=Achroia grisella TaxID=688607 RepID=UPI0027D30A16|nr:uncharacterized protein LOC131855041 [Achroia grisella]